MPEGCHFLGGVSLGSWNSATGTRSCALQHGSHLDMRPCPAASGRDRPARRPFYVGGTALSLGGA
jgi:hypothetical protein